MLGLQLHVLHASTAQDFDRCAGRLPCAGFIRLSLFCSQRLLCFLSCSLVVPRCAPISDGGFALDNHARKEYVRGPAPPTRSRAISLSSSAHEGRLSHCVEQHLHRYLAKFDFRYNTRPALGYADFMRAADRAALSAKLDAFSRGD
jgi:hypothetical protein